MQSIKSLFTLLFKKKVYPESVDDFDVIQLLQSGKQELIIQYLQR